MSERASFLNRNYGAYYHRERPPEDEELTQSAPVPRAVNICDVSGNPSSRPPSLWRSRDG